MKRTPYFFSYRSTNWRGSAAPATTTVRRLDISCVSFSRKLYKSHPERRHAGAENVALLLHELGDVGGLKMPAAQHDPRSNHYRRVRNTPAIGVKHRDQLQNRVALAQGEAVRHVRP